ncbi:MAG: hypothetical protein WCR46_25540 [Deltaproteobacteria bacterium]
MMTSIVNTIHPGSFPRHGQNLIRAQNRSRLSLHLDFGQSLKKLESWGM